MDPLLSRLAFDRGGVTAVEYALIGSLIATGIVTGLTLIGADIVAYLEPFTAAL